MESMCAVGTITSVDVDGDLLVTFNGQSMRFLALELESVRFAVGDRVELQHGLHTLHYMRDSLIPTLVGRHGVVTSIDALLMHVRVRFDPDRSELYDFDPVELDIVERAPLPVSVASHIPPPPLTAAGTATANAVSTPTSTPSTAASTPGTQLGGAVAEPDPDAGHDKVISFEQVRDQIGDDSLGVAAVSTVLWCGPQDGNDSASAYAPYALICRPHLGALFDVLLPMTQLPLSLRTAAATHLKQLPFAAPLVNVGAPSTSSFHFSAEMYAELLQDAQALQTITAIGDSTVAELCALAVRDAMTASVADSAPVKLLRQLCLHDPRANAAVATSVLTALHTTASVACQVLKSLCVPNGFRVPHFTNLGSNRLVATAVRSRMHSCLNLLRVIRCHASSRHDLSPSDFSHKFKRCSFLVRNMFHHRSLPKKRHSTSFDIIQSVWWVHASVCCRTKAVGLRALSHQPALDPTLPSAWSTTTAV